MIIFKNKISMTQENNMLTPKDCIFHNNRIIKPRKYHVCVFLKRSRLSYTGFEFKFVTRLFKY